MQVAVVENSTIAPIGTFGTWLKARGATFVTIPGTAAAERRDELAAADLVVTLGSAAAAYDPDPWIVAQRTVLADLATRGHAVIGICFGAQLLSSALGGAVARLPDGPRLGWFANDEAAAPAWGGPWLRWHGDHFTNPPGGEVLARSGDLVMAFRYRRALGVQFHPEVVEEGLAAWIGFTEPEHLRGRDPVALRRDLMACVDGAAEARTALFEEMLRLTTGPD